MMKFNRKGQNSLEYVLLITAVVVAFLGIQHYLNRGLQGRVRDAADSIGSQFDAQATASSFTTTRSSNVTETTIAGVTRSELANDELTIRQTSETIGAPSAAIATMAPGSATGTAEARE